MSSQPVWWHWIALTVSAILAIAGIALLLWALFSDRSRGRRRCPKCWYDMTGVPGLVCPECGKNASSERRLFRTRRRWKLAAVGALVPVFALGALCWSPAAQTAIAPYVPSTVLLLWKGQLYDDAFTKPFARELTTRYTMGRLSDWQWRAVLREDPELRRTNMKPGIVTRHRWPIASPVYVEVAPWGRSSWLSRWVEISPLFDGGQPVTRHRLGLSFNVSYASSPPDFTLNIGTPPPGTTELRLQVDAYEGSSSAPARRFLMWSGVDTVPVTIGGSIDDVITPIRTESATADVRSTLNLKVDPEGSPVFSLKAPGSAELNDAVIPLVIEFVHGDELVAHAKIRVRAEREPSPWNTVRPHVIGDSTRILAADPSDPVWRIRIRGDGELALRDFTATRYWAGQYEVGLDEVFVPFQKPVPENTGR